MFIVEEIASYCFHIYWMFFIQFEKYLFDWYLSSSCGWIVLFSVINLSGIWFIYENIESNQKFDVFPHATLMTSVMKDIYEINVELTQVFLNYS